jgi:hypothetical protein
MALAKAMPNTIELRGSSLRQAHLHLGVTILAQATPSRYSFFPMHTGLANHFEPWFRQKGNTATPPDQGRQTLRRNLYPLYEWLVSLFDNAGKHSG